MPSAAPSSGHRESFCPSVGAEAHPAADQADLAVVVEQAQLEAVAEALQQAQVPQGVVGAPPGEAQQVRPLHPYLQRQPQDLLHVRARVVGVDAHQAVRRRPRPGPGPLTESRSPAM